MKHRGFIGFKNPFIFVSITKKSLRFYFYDKNPFENPFVFISMIKNPFENPFEPNFIHLPSLLTTVNHF